MRRLLRSFALIAFHVLFVRPLLYLGVGVRYRRRSLVPRGPCLVVSNHNSHLDAAVLMSLFPLRLLPRVHPVAAADYFGKTWLKRTMAMLFMNGVPFERRPKAGVDPLSPLADRLIAGDRLIFFPEGSRGEAGVMSPFRPGVGRLVHQVPGLLVVPVFLSGPERIWPRGQVVPVPLGIDVTVGRPRTYPADLPAKTIAELVQRDVAQLAPPPPPVPGPRPAPPVRVAVCGIDDQARERLARAITARLGRSERTLAIAASALEADGEGVREVTGPIAQARAWNWIGLLAAIFARTARFKGRKFAEMVERAQIDEAAGQARSFRFLVTEGSALVDLVAWAEADFYAGRFEPNEMNRLMQYVSGQKKIPFAHWWRFVRHAPEVWLINRFDLARPPVPDVLVLVSTPATSVMSAIRSRGEALEPHHTEAFFEKLTEAYARMGGVLKKRRRVELLELDPEQVGDERIVLEVEAACRRAVESPREGPVSAPGRTTLQA